MNLTTFIILGGIGQICLVIGSTGIPKILGWKQELQKVNPFLKKIFWVYAGYILITNLCIGLVSAFASDTLVERTKLSTIVTGFMMAYWLSRTFIQFFIFERKHFPVGLQYKIGECMLVALFIYLTIVYGYTFYFNLSGL